VNSQVGIVIPAFDAGHHLRTTLPAVQRVGRGAPVVVVDAGSTDDTAVVAAEHGARVVSLPRREGPARARNVGARAIEADVILFLDADCVPHSDVVEKVQAAFDGEPTLVALTGSYDANPPEQGFFSQYMNLRHRFFHQRARRTQATFWAGCGAVRRQALLDVGGFDAERYPVPQIEDIELGLRLRAVGETRLDPDLQVTHLKRWSLRSVVETDIRSRAIPWSRLLLEKREVPDDLNLAWSQRLAALAAPFVVAAPFLVPWAAWSLRFGVLALVALALSTSAALHADMLRYFANLRGRGFALRAWLFHQVHLTYGATTMGLCVLVHLARELRSGGGSETFGR